jgi:membrane protein DedA with SNARE-associated domain
LTLQSIIQSYGYWAILVGTFLEGETILVLGGLAAFQGFLSLPGVILAAFTGSLCGDQLFFFLGRRYNQAVLARRPTWKDRVAKAERLLNRFRTPLILIFRFLYGLRTVTPFVIGMSTVPTRIFVPLNAIGALVWAMAVGVLGYAFGSIVETVIGNIKHYKMEVFGGIAAIGLCVWAVYFYRQRKRRFPTTKPSPEKR